MKARMPKVALACLCLLLILSTVNSLNQGGRLLQHTQHWQAQLPLWKKVMEAPQLLRLYQQRLDQIVAQSKSAQTDSVLLNPLSLSYYLEKRCKDRTLRITRLPVETRTEQTGFLNTSTRFSLEGSFRDIVALLFQLEQKDRIGQLEQVHLETRQTHKDGRTHRILLAHIKLHRSQAL